MTAVDGVMIARRNYTLMAMSRARVAAAAPPPRRLRARSTRDPLISLIHIYATFTTLTLFNLPTSNAKVTNIKFHSLQLIYTVF